MLVVVRVDGDAISLRIDMASDRLDHTRIEPGLQRSGADLAVTGIAPPAGIAEHMPDVVQQARQHHVCAGLVGRGEGRRLKRMIEHGHPLAVGLACRVGEPLKQKVDDGDFRAEQGSSLPARIRLEPGEVGDRRRDGERGHVRPTRGRRHTAGSANDDKSLQHVRHEVGMIPADPAMVGRDEH